MTIAGGCALCAHNPTLPRTCASRLFHFSIGPFILYLKFKKKADEGEQVRMRQLLPPASR